MASTISFTKGGTTVTFTTGRKYPEAPNEDLRQTRMFAMGGSPVVVTHDSTTLQRPLIVLVITDSKFTELRNFIYTTCSGSEESFTFTDHDSSTLTVRYIGGIKPARRLKHDRWRVELQLAEVPS